MKPEPLRGGWGHMEEYLRDNSSSGRTLTMFMCVYACLRTRVLMGGLGVEAENIRHVTILVYEERTEF
jgi:hypothetical protein